MGMARQAPMDMYQRKYFVHDHAVERLRERLKRSGDTTHRANDDLGNLIDWAVSSSMESGTFEKVLDEGEPAIIVDVSEPLQDALWAIVKQNRTPRVSGHHQIVLTILTRDMMERRKQSGKWVDSMELTGPLPSLSPGAAGHGSIGTLGEVARMKQAKAPAAQSQVRKAVQSTVETRMLLWVTRDGKPLHAEYPVEVASEEYIKLLCDPSVGSVRVFKEIKMKTIAMEE